MSWFARILGRPSAVQAPARPPAAQLASTTSLPEAVPAAALLEKIGWKKPAMWASVLTPACQKHEIVTRLRLAAFLANTGHETGGGSTLVESLNYSAEALIEKFGRHRITIEQASRLGRTASHPAQQEALANQLYGGEWPRYMMAVRARKRRRWAMSPCRSCATGWCASTPRARTDL